MNSELARRIAFTLGALLVYRIGTHIPLPGINPAVWDQIFRQPAGGLLGMVNVPLGRRAWRGCRCSALGIVPYVSAAILLQLMSLARAAAARAARMPAKRGRRAIDALHAALTVADLAAFQSYGIALALEGVTGLVLEPGWPFRLTTVLTLTGGTMFLTWLAGQITARGIGNGIALILCRRDRACELPRRSSRHARARPAGPVVGQSASPALRCLRSR